MDGKENSVNVNPESAGDGMGISPEQDLEALVAFLDGRVGAGDSRITVDVAEGEGGVIARQYHHGRCDVGSPWACGTAFDVLE